jgi:hypothetical protein
MKVGTMLFSQINLPGYGATYMEVTENNQDCHCGEKDMLTVEVKYNWDVGLNRDTDLYDLPYNKRGRQIKQCEKSLLEEIKKHKVKIVSEEEKKQRNELWEKYH